MLEITGLDEFIRDIQDQRFWDALGQAILIRLHDIGLEKAQLKFANIQYAGTLAWVDITAQVTGNTAEIRASGFQVLFIEFGTGIRYENPHMEDFGFFAGSYGQGKGVNEQGWWYRGTPQPNDPPDTTRSRWSNTGTPIMHTYGSPANMPMYETQKELEDELVNIVREALNDTKA